VKREANIGRKNFRTIGLARYERRFTSDEKMDNKKLVIALLCLGNIAITFNIGAVAAAIPLISADLGLSDISVSRIVPFYMIPYGLGALLYAPLTRYFNYRTILIAAMLVYALMSWISGYSGMLEHILWAQVGAGIAAAGSTPRSLMIIGEFFEKNVRGRMVGS
jgi:MFS family permease